MVKGGSSQMRKKLTDEIINAAIDGFTAQKAQLSQRIAELRAMLNGGSPQAAAAAEPAPRKRRKFSATARRRMREAQRLRWAKIRGESEGAAYSTTRAIKPKRRISEEGMKRIVAATKRRWRLQRAAAKAKSAKGAKKAA
jgi:cell division septum initiation protein DivIVA